MQKKKIFLRRLLRPRASNSSPVYGVLSLGAFGVVSVEAGLLTRNQRESVRKVLARRLKPVGGRYWVSIDHFVSLTKKAKGARMGKGRGGFSDEKAPIRSGHILCEFSGVDEPVARKIHASLSKKLPVKTRIVFDAIA